MFCYFLIIKERKKFPFETRKGSFIDGSQHIHVSIPKEIWKKVEELIREAERLDQRLENQTERLKTRNNDLENLESKYIDLTTRVKKASNEHPIPGQESITDLKTQELLKNLIKLGWIVLGWIVLFFATFVKTLF